VNQHRIGTPLKAASNNLIWIREVVSIDADREPLAMPVLVIQTRDLSRRDSWF
jgi:hypothetical protein